MAKLQAHNTAGFNAGKTFYAKPFRVSEIVIDPEISRIFKIHDQTREEIKEKIKKFGYDKSQPVVVQKGTNVLVDGHTRLAAAKAAGLDEVPAYEMEFEDREAAIMYTFERQVIRRNLTGPEILTAARMIHGRKETDGKGRAAELLAERLGIAASTVYQARAILKEGTEEDIEEVQDGKKSIKKKYKEVKSRAAPERKSEAADTPSPTGKTAFLSEAVILLVTAGHTESAGLLISRLLDSDERDGFYARLPKDIILSAVPAEPCSSGTA